MDTTYPNETTDVIDDFSLPQANINRIINNAVSEEMKISRRARELIQSACAEFIGFFTAQACETLKADERRTLRGTDLICNMHEFGLS